MKQLHIFLFCALCCMACGGEVVVPKEETTKVVAFPGADGGGKYATGGRGGMVYHVTTLEDDIKNPGSLRAVLRMSGKKMIVFDVAGVIELKSELAITEGAVTISGQSAPGNGICIANYPVVVKASNVIIRFVRFRMGDKRGAEGDAFTCRGMKNVIIDHCSFSWSTDECVSCYGNSDFTLQYCFITESLRRSVHVKGNHGYGGIWGGKDATFHHNLLAHHDSRNPRFDHDYVDATCHGPIDYVNNVIYNWGGNSAYGGESVSEPRQINMIANYYKAGPATRHKTRIINPTDSCSNCTTSGKVVPGLFYLEGNYVEGNAQVTADNYKGMDPYIEQCKAPAAFQAPEYTRETAQEAIRPYLTRQVHHWYAMP